MTHTTIIMKKAAASLMCFLASVFVLCAQRPDITFKARASYTLDKNDNYFKGERFLVHLDGNLGDHFTYSARHNFNKSTASLENIPATDWLYLTYSPDGRWRLGGGKIIVDYGSFEYDAAPIDLYIIGDYWNNFGAFQFGAFASYSWDNDMVRFQIQRSPFFTEDLKSLKTYNFLWNGTHGIWQPMYTLNFMEYDQGEFSTHLAFGNRFTLGKFIIDADFMNRSDTSDMTLLKSYSANVQAAYKPSDKLKVYAKFARDFNDEQEGFRYDYLVGIGSDYNQCGGGLEYYVIPRVRLHAYYVHQWGRLSGLNADNDVLSLGLTWTFSL